MKRILLFAVLCLGLFTVRAQDTVTVMAYNLLFYPTQNPTRYNDLKEIVQYAKPDIFICSELYTEAGADLLLTNSFNASPVNYYARANFVNGPDSDNMLYYNKNKLTLASQHQISTDLRDISHYRLYSCASSDTVWYDVFSAHLKAGNSPSDADARNNEATDFCNYLATLPGNGNIIFGGDMNFYGASIEPAWAKLTTGCTHNLLDPINQVGEWHANLQYKNYHTQSTRNGANPGCCTGATGGMDDRFDFLLMNQNLRDGLRGTQYIPNSYKAVGNDGNHFNKSLLDAPANSSVPANVNTALFNMSDHLPVLMKLKTCNAPMGIAQAQNMSDARVVIDAQGQMFIQTEGTIPGKVTAEIIGINGAVVAIHNFNAQAGQNQFTLPLNVLGNGMYVLRLLTPDGIFVKKLIF